MGPFLVTNHKTNELGWEFYGKVTNFTFLSSVTVHFRRRKHWSTVSNKDWVRLAPETLMLWEE